LTCVEARRGREKFVEEQEDERIYRRARAAPATTMERPYWAALVGAAKALLVLEAAALAPFLRTSEAEAMAAD